MGRKKGRKSAVSKDKQPSSSSISTSNPEVDLAEECMSWGNLLPDVLEIICQQLIKRENSILTCRLINSHWKSVAESILEQICLSNFKNCPSAPNPLIPRLSTATSEDARVLEKIWCPKFLNNWDRNPFPSKSLLISGSNHNHHHQTLKRNFYPVSVFKWMANLGHNLSSVSLDMVTFTSPDFLKLLLDEMSNLKALSLSNISLMTEDKNFMEKFHLAPLQRLEVLNLFINLILSSNQDFRCGTFNNWLATSYGKTLTHLEIDEAEELSLNPANFPNLQVLTMRDVGKDTFHNSQGLPQLQRMSIDCLSDESFQTTRFKDYVGFIEKFAHSLVQLNLSVSMDEMDGSQNIELERSTNPSFPNLKSFSYMFPSKTTESELVVLKVYFLPKFPALDKLRLLLFNQTSHHNMRNDDDDENRTVIKDYLEREDFWDSCPKLRSIHVFGGPNEKRDALYVSYRPNIVKTV